MRSQALLAAAGVAVLTLSGCFSAQQPASATMEQGAIWSPDDPRLSQPTYSEIHKEHHLVRSFDGTLMDNSVWRPVVPDGVTVPVFINFSPYWSNLAPTAESGGDAFSQYMIDYFVPRGYAVVLSSVRGTGYSEGCFNLGGSVEQRDAYEVVEYFGNQPWSSGNVGAGGKSYDGTTPNGVAVLNPPSLKTIIPVSPISELYKYNYKDGVSYGQGYRFNQYYYMGVGMDVNYGPGPKTDRLDLILDDVNCPYLPEMQAWGLASGVLGDSSEYWEERNYTKDAAKATAAMWLIHGLQDWNVKPDHILPWMNAYGGPVKAWLHQWQDDCCGGHVYPMRADWNVTMLRWLDHWLKGVDTGIMQEPAIQVQDTQGRWRNEQHWPPMDAAPLLLQMPNQRAAAPGTTGAASHVIRYALNDDLHVAGEILVQARVVSDAPHGLLTLHVYEEDEKGERELITFGGLNLRHRAGLDADPQPVDPGQSYDVTVRLHPADAWIPSNHSIVVVAGSTSPYFWSDLEPFADSVYPDRIDLLLPVKTSAPTFEDPAPVELERCWAC